LNRTEAVALISSQLLEFMRDGCYSVSQLMDIGKQMLGRRHVISDVFQTLHEVQIEGTFPDGTYLVTVHDPICTDDGNLEMALYGSFCPIPSDDKFPLPPQVERKDAPGAIIVQPGTIELNAGRRRLSISVTNYGDRPIQVRIIQFRTSECIYSFVYIYRLDPIIILSKPMHHFILTELLVMV
jgi:urease